MEASSEPQIRLAEKTLPAPLWVALRVFFRQRVPDCVLAGGTALAGFYAGHRRSDDLDLFTGSPAAQRAAAVAVRTLSKIGVDLKTLLTTESYYEGLARLDGHAFKITIVLDENLFRVGRVLEVSGHVWVVDLKTIFKMKAATLVSRCSEKDLFDLVWLFERFSSYGLPDLIRLGLEIDAGVSGESILLSLSGATLRPEACDFALDPKKTSQQVWSEIMEFRDRLLHALMQHLENQPIPPLGELVKTLRALKPSRLSRRG